MISEVNETLCDGLTLTGCQVLTKAAQSLLSTAAFAFLIVPLVLQ